MLESLRGDMSKVLSLLETQVQETTALRKDVRRAQKSLRELRAVCTVDPARLAAFEGKEEHPLYSREVLENEEFHRRVKDRHKKPPPLPMSPPPRQEH